jgi:uncharacterized protein with ParB-like and HNH nuclease domain
MINKVTNQWSGKSLYKKTKEGSVTFNNAIQRNLVWDDKRNSLLIHSILTGFPIPPFYTVKKGDKYDMLDGKQRSNAIASFIDDEYLLILDEDYREVDGEFIEGKKFSELSEELQDRIKDVSLSICFFDETITDDEVEEMFFRLNNGKPFTSIELTRVKAKSIDIIKNLAAHELLTTALSKKAIQKYNNEAIVMNTYMTIYNNEPSYTSKHVREVIQSVDITVEQTEQITAVFNKILAVHNSLVNSDSKVSKRILKKTHLLSLTKLASVISESDLRDFVREFFAGTGRSATVNDKYNSACQFGSAKPESVAKRLSEIQKYYDRMKGNAEILEQVTAKIPEIKPHVKSDIEVLKESDAYFNKLDTESMFDEVEKEFAETGLDDISEEVDKENVG